MSDIQADKYPTGHVLDYFGVPSAYSRTPIRALKDRTVKLGSLFGTNEFDTAHRTCVYLTRGIARL